MAERTKLRLWEKTVFGSGALGTGVVTTVVTPVVTTIITTIIAAVIAAVITPVGRPGLAARIALRIGDAWRRRRRPHIAAPRLVAAHHPRHLHDFRHIDHQHAIDPVVVAGFHQ